MTSCPLRNYVIDSLNAGIFDGINEEPYLAVPEGASV